MPSPRTPHRTTSRLTRSKMSDSQLVEQVQEGKRDVYEEIVKRYEKPLLRYARYLTKQSEFSPDIVQNAFIKAYINLKSFDVTKKLSSWLYRIVHNEAVNRIRKESRFFSFEDIEWVENIFSRSAPIEDSLQTDEIRKLLKESLQEIPLSYRAPLILFYLEEKSYDEISDVLRIPMGTVGTRINRGKKYLKKVVQKKGGEAYVR